MLAATLLFSFSCKKDDNEETTTTGFSAKVEGNAWTASNTLAGHDNLTNITQITGIGSSVAEQIHLIFKGSGTGTYKMNADNIGAVEITNYSFTSFFSETPVGEIVITKYDVTNMKISGTFKFEGEDIDGTVYNLTEGKFDNVILVVQ